MSFSGDLKPPKAQLLLSKSPSASTTKMNKLPRISNEIFENGENIIKRPSSLPKKQDKISKNESDDSIEEGQIRPVLGPIILKQARDQVAENPHRALQSALRAAKCFEMSSNGKLNLDLVMCLHVVAAILCKLEQHDEALSVLERAIEIPLIEAGPDSSLAKFSSFMQLGDTHAMLGQIENSIQCYLMGLEVQKHVLGENDSRVGDTCRYIAEAHMQALQFDEAEELCLEALQIHKEQQTPGALEETVDRNLLGLICEVKGDHKAALEHLTFASTGMMSNGQDEELASIDCRIGDAYLSLAQYDEAVVAYQKALTIFKSTKGKNHPAVASVIVRLASLHNKIGNFKESKSYCESALRIYEKPLLGTPHEEIASGFTEISAIYESMNESCQAISILHKALNTLNIYNNIPGQKSVIAGIEAQIGVLHYIMGDYIESYNSFKNAIEKLRMCGEKKPAFFGLVLNQMGLACVQQNAIIEAAELFQEAASVLEQEYGLYYPDTLGVYSNLAGVYDAMGRLDEAIDILDHVVHAREKLGTAISDVDDEKKRLSILLNETNIARHKKNISLEEFLYPSRFEKWHLC